LEVVYRLSDFDS